MTLIMKSVMMKKMFAIDKVKKKNCIKGIGAFFVINLILLKILIYMKHLTNFN